jgi:hypothetical protein
LSGGWLWKYGVFDKANVLAICAREGFGGRVSSQVDKKHPSKNRFKKYCPGPNINFLRAERYNSYCDMVLALFWLFFSGVLVVRLKNLFYLSPAS